MLIFDSFNSRNDAQEFAKAVTEKYNRSATVYDTQEQSNAIDLFPFKLYAPIVLVERQQNYELEPEIKAMVQSFGGEFAGT